MLARSTIVSHVTDAPHETRARDAVADYAATAHCEQL